MFAFELIFMIILGTVFTILGWRIWKHEQISLIHSYHYTKVTPAGKKPYTSRMGKALILMGVGMYLAGIIDFIFRSGHGLIAFGVCFIGGLVIMTLAQMKYNHGIF